MYLSQLLHSRHVLCKALRFFFRICALEIIVIIIIIIIIIIMTVVVFSSRCSCWTISSKPNLIWILHGPLMATVIVSICLWLWMLVWLWMLWFASVYR